MKLSLNWIADFIDLGDYASKPEELGRLLTSVGIEVESIEDLTARFKNMVVGHLLSVEKHPNAEKLTLCQVDVGDGKNRQIVCGAKNHKTGDKVVVTLPGAVLPSGLEIKLSKIRDVESQGMLASESELGLKAESEGILLLDKNTPVGKPIAEVLGLNDVIFEVSVTPNRADCLSHFGIARELSTLLNKPLKRPKIDFKATSESTKKKVSVEIKSKFCSRYAGRLVENVKIGPSPDWLKQRLEKVGAKSINNVVDVTNYVMFELGHPLHAFDLAELHGSKILVEEAKAGETFKSFDGTEIKFKGDELTIRDADRPVALAGVVGGVNSGVTDSTKNLFIESAHFDFDAVRRVSRRYGIQTESSYRFSRGTDVNMVMVALDRACQLMSEVAGGQVAGDSQDVKSKEFEPAMIKLPIKLVEDRLGYHVPKETILDWMRRVGCEIVSAGGGDKSADAIEVKAPSYRSDVKIKEDLIEEIGRLQGYEAIPEKFPAIVKAPLAHDSNFEWERKWMRLSVQGGMIQAINHGFVASSDQSKLLGDGEALKLSGLSCEVNAVFVKNPLNENINVMRSALSVGLLTNLEHNIRYGTPVGQLFEVGKVFAKLEKSETSEGGYKESSRWAGLRWGVEKGLWQKSEAAPSVLDLKESILDFFKSLQIKSVSFESMTKSPSFVHPGQAAIINVEGQKVGFIGSLHPQWLKERKINVSAAIAELDLEKLRRGQPRALKVKTPSKFPAVERDLAFVTPKDLPVVNIEKEIRKVVGAELHSVKVFDVFEGGSLEAGKRSVAVKMFLVQDKTWSEEELMTLQGKIVSHVEKKLSITLR